MIKPLKIERIAKGFAHHYRVETLILLGQQSELSVGDIARKIKADEKNTSQHLLKMAIAGLIMKRHEGAEVKHKLTDQGRLVLRFLAKLN